MSLSRKLGFAALLFAGLAGALFGQDRAKEIVRELGELPPVLAGAAPSTGIPDPVEVRRKRVYAELRAMGAAALPALTEGLGDEDVRVRRGAALYLLVAASTWGGLDGTPLNIRAALPALIEALGDADGRLRATAAQAVGAVGAEAAAAVPALLEMLAMPDEGSRNTACMALGSIGSPAAAALPALRRALGDSSADVRRFARAAIGKIEGRPAGLP